MMWPFKKNSNIKKCLVCEKKGQHKAEVQYSYKGGTGTAHLCDKCAEHFDVMAVDHDESL